jgi:7,8-dihydropterin-6-yl-methyl-4-(beta-D-ribofuranosyl)aminobenzene 5'-phosphate synthase
MKLTVLYDNLSDNRAYIPDWGFSCLVQGLKKTILFDTGAKPDILRKNMESLGIAIGSIDVVFLSHDHYDHTGGINVVLEGDRHPEVWIPPSFPADIQNTIREQGGILKQAKIPEKICEGAFSTGEIHGWINEQSLVLESDSGLVVVTGCAHPRIVRILNVVKESFSGNLYLVLGGFHLSAFDKRELVQIAAAFRELGVKKVGPCHCTGDEAREIFSEEYGPDFFDVRTGFEIEFQ